MIAAAVIGGTSFAGGIGTIPGAVLGAVVMQSLRSGMVLLNIDSPTQDIVVGIVLVAAVGFDSYIAGAGRLSEEGAMTIDDRLEPAPQRPLVEMRDIRVAFGGVHAVDGVTDRPLPGRGRRPRRRQRRRQVHADAHPLGRPPGRLAARSSSTASR